MPARHLQPFVHSLTKLCRHTTLVEQCLSNGHQQISQRLSYAELQDGLKARAYSTPESTWKVRRIFNHLVNTPLPSSPKLEEREKEGKKKKKIFFLRHKGEKMYPGKGSLFIFVFIVKAILKVLQSEFFLKSHCW